MGCPVRLGGVVVFAIGAWREVVRDWLSGVVEDTGADGRCYGLRKHRGFKGVDVVEVGWVAKDLVRAVYSILVSSESTRRGKEFVSGYNNIQAKRIASLKRCIVVLASASSS